MKIKPKKAFFFALLIFVFSSFTSSTEDDIVYNSSVDAVGFISDRSGAVASGFFINRNTFVTNVHVTEDLDVPTAVIEMKDGSTFGVKRIIDEYDSIDLAIIRTIENSKTSLKLENDHFPEVHDLVYSLGNPTDSNDHVDYFKMTKGTIKQVVEDDWFYESENEDNHKALLIKHTAMIRPGNSGGPLLNNRGNVVGVNTFFYDDSLNYAIHVDELRQVLNYNGIKYNEAGSTKEMTKRSSDREEKTDETVDSRKYFFSQYYLVILSASLLYYMLVSFGIVIILTYLSVKGNRRSA